LYYTVPNPPGSKVVVWEVQSLRLRCGRKIFITVDIWSRWLMDGNIKSPDIRSGKFSKRKNFKF
jgi:hypothetical protein